MKIYLDMVVILNFLVDFLLILGTNRISGYPFGVKRAAAAALVGSMYAAACLLPGFSFLGNGLWRAVSLCLIAAVTFGIDLASLRRGVLFFFLSMALGGVALGLGNGGFGSILLGAVGVCLLCILGFPGKPGQQHYVPVHIMHGGREVSLTALVDTGNTLRDPISGLPVLVVDANAAEILLGLTVHQLARPVETVGCGACEGLRLIPYSAVGQSGGMLLAIRVESLRINGKKENMIVAFAPQNIGRGRCYQALAGGIV